MKKKIISICCCLAILCAAIFPCLCLVSAVEDGVEITLSDESKWKIDTDTQKNTFATDNDGRYSYTTTDPKNSASGFKIVSQKAFPLSSTYLMRCYDGLGGINYFGLSTVYSLDMDDTNSIRFSRTNAYLGRENDVAIKVMIDGKYVLAAVLSGYVRNRYSAITVVKENGSYYMSWNGAVINGDGYSSEVKDACKLENHFSKDLLDNGAFFHYFCGCTKMNVESGFNLQIDKSLDNGFLKCSLDSFGDDANSPVLEKANEVSGSVDAEQKIYTVNVKDSGASSIAPMIPITSVDENGVSPEFRTEIYLNDYDSLEQQWVGLTFSDDPMFSSGNEKTVYFVQIQDYGGVHCGYFDNGTWKTYFGTFNSFFNSGDPADNHKYFYFDKVNGETVLKLYADGLVNKSSAFQITGFSNFAGKDIYIRFNNRSVTDGATVTAKVTSAYSDKIKTEIESLGKIIDSNPKTLEEIEDVLNKYDGNAYRYAVSAEKISAVEELRMECVKLKREKLNKDLARLRQRIDGLPTPDNITSANKDEIISILTSYEELGENKSELGSEYFDKLLAAINALCLVDNEFSAMKKGADDFYNDVKAVGSADDIAVANYSEKAEVITGLRERYSKMQNIQSYLVDDKAVKLLKTLEARLQTVKPSYELVENIKALPDVDKITYKDEDSVGLCRDLYNNLTDKTLVDKAYADKIADCEEAVRKSKLACLDWYCPYRGTGYTGDAESSYSFNSTVDDINGEVLTTTTKAYNAKTDCLYWMGMGCGSGQFAIMGLCTDTENSRLSNSSTDNISFILRPVGSDLHAVFYDAAGESETIAIISGFSMSAMHKFEFINKNGHWYLAVDGTVCEQYSYSRFDAFMETYGENAHFYIGARNGFSASNVLIKNKNASTAKGGWDFSLPYGCNVKGSASNPNLTMPSGAQAVYQTKLDNLQNWSVTINANKATESCMTYVGFLKDKIPSSKTLCDASDNGIVLMMYNRPAAGDYRTHILMNIAGTTMTYDAYEPAIIDADYFTLSVVRASDMHYYLKISWESGSVVFKFDRSNEYYRSLFADSLVENGAYFTITTNYKSDVDLEFKYEEHEDVFEDTAEAAAFIVELEKNMPALKKLDKNAYKKMYDLWEKLDFSNRNSVAGDLSDDEDAFNALSIIKNFKDRQFEKYVIVEEQKIVNKSSLQTLIEECKNDLEATFRIVLESGKELFSNLK